jgi:6-phosphogluconolactonase/glucosamine-6-phosphate isomerase/deaminase
MCDNSVFQKLITPKEYTLFGTNTTQISNRAVGNTVWLKSSENDLADYQAREAAYEILPTEEAVGQAMFEELEKVFQEKQGDIAIALLGGRGAQALHRLLGEKAKTNEIDDLLFHLNVCTQDALAPMRMNNSLSFVRDFERLLGEAFFQKIKSFTPMQTDTSDLEGELEKYIEKLDALSGLDIFFLGFGPEANDASHLAYIKPNSGANLNDVAGIIPISNRILEHHISKFKAGGSEISEADEAECRNAAYILTLGPAAILKAKRIVQSIVDASNAPAKRACYRNFLETKLSEDLDERAKQLNANPGLWLRLHPNVRSLILPDVLEK